MRFYNEIREEAFKSALEAPADARCVVENMIANTLLAKELRDADVGHEEAILVGCAALLAQSADPKRLLGALSVYLGEENNGRKNPDPQSDCKSA